MVGQSQMETSSPRPIGANIWEAQRHVDISIIKARFQMRSWQCKARMLCSQQHTARVRPALHHDLVGRSVFLVYLSTSIDHHLLGAPARKTCPAALWEIIPTPVDSVRMLQLPLPIEAQLKHIE